MKTYKHKQTGDIVELVNDSGYRFNKSIIGLIPKEYIENSSDWEEIVEYPIGTRVFKLETGSVFERIEKGWVNIDIISGYKDEDIIKDLDKKFLIITDYNLTYKDLIDGEYYTTIGQGLVGLYTFQKNRNKWYGHKYKNKYISKQIDDFNPKNGFYNFRLATKEEINVFNYEKDFEILSFIHNKQTALAPEGLIVTKQIDKKFKTSININLSVESSEEKFIEHPDWDIHSVKRLSDGEIFTLNDRTKNKNHTIISKIILKEDIMFLFLVSTKNCLFLYDSLIELKNCKKAKPLFTTDDNVEIYGGDEFYFIGMGNKNFIGGLGKLIASEDGRAKFAYKRFSTKEAGEEYILLNKPCLSIVDIQSIYISATEGYKKRNSKVTYLEKLKELAKSKM